MVREEVSNYDSTSDVLVKIEFVIFFFSWQKCNKRGLVDELLR